MRLLRLQMLVVMMAFAELAGVASIGPFMALVGGAAQLEGDGILARIYQYTGSTNQSSFVFWVGVGVLVSLTLAAVISMLTTWRLSLYAQQVGAEISIRLFKHYMQQPWLFHAGSNSSVLTNNVSQESIRVTDGIIGPLMQMNAKVVMAGVMAGAIFLFNPVVALVGIIIFFSSYFILYRLVRSQLSVGGDRMTQAQNLRFKLMSEGFGGIKDVLILGRQSYFNRQFEAASHTFSHAKGSIIALSQVPRYAMELVAFGSVIFLVLYLLSAHQGNFVTVLPILSVYALAGFKLLPAFQQIYSSIATIRGNMAAFATIHQDLLASVGGKAGSDVVEQSCPQPQISVSLENIVFQYPGSTNAALNGLTLTLPANKIIGLVGSSGSGKTTAIDILLGLMSPQTGKLCIDNVPLELKQLRAWQNKLGFVPQSIYLADASIRENIAFGLPTDLIDEKRVSRAVKMAHLDELLARLPEGLATKVGERGIQLSGGQRQRIGIARALYDNADILVLDEATSALDGITEKLVMDAIHDFSGKKTIVLIAHRLSTVRQCSMIYFMDSGRVVDSGTYDELFARNAVFREMAENISDE